MSKVRFHLSEHILKVLGTPGLRHLLHQLVRLAELVQELVDILGGGAAAVGDAPPAPAVDDFRRMPFIGSHRPDDRLELDQLLFVELFRGFAPQLR